MNKVKKKKKNKNLTPNYNSTVYKFDIFLGQLSWAISTK